MTLNWFFFTELILRLVMVVVVVRRRRSAPIALAWLGVIAFVPVVGVVAYFFVGENRLGQRRAAAYAEAMKTRPALTETSALPSAISDDLEPVARLADALGAFPASRGNSLELLVDAEEYAEHLVEAIDGARDRCHLLYYIVHDDEIGTRVADALIEAVDRGLTCRLLADAVGSKVFFRGALPKRLQRGGVEVVPLLPVGPLRALAARADLRNHRKIAVIDGRVAFSGSHNVSRASYPGQEAYGPWVDLSVRLEGPAVAALEEIFLWDLAFNTDRPFPTDSPSPPAPAGRSVVSILPPDSPFGEVLQQALRGARREVVLTTPYFVPADALVEALRSAALRGVRVVLNVPRRSNHPIAQAAGRSHYDYLLSAGVEIFEYAGGLLHAKSLTADGRLAIVGSANLDVRSFLLNFETEVLVFDPEVAGKLRELQEGFLFRSTPVKVGYREARGRLGSFGDDLARLLTPLL